jgi:hypothetical protein
MLQGGHPKPNRDSPNDYEQGAVEWAISFWIQHSAPIQGPELTYSPPKNFRMRSSALSRFSIEVA